jgi:hypothetical protein
MVSGRPKVSVKKRWVGSLHMLVHIPTHPLFSRYRHFVIFTPDRHVSVRPSNGTSTSITSDGPTSQVNPSVVIQALNSALRLFSGNQARKRSGAWGGSSEESTPATASCCCAVVRPRMISRDSSTNPS